MADEDEPVRADETAEEFSPAWLGTGEEKTPPPPSYVATWWNGWFIGCVTGALVSSVVWYVFG